MQITLKSVKVNAAFSQETTCFRCEIWVDGKKAGSAENSGNGGSTHIFPHDLKVRLDTHAKALPPLDMGDVGLPGETMVVDAELLIFNLVDAFQSAQRMRRALGSKIVFTKVGSTELYTIAVAKGGDVLARARALDADAARKASSKIDVILNLLTEEQAAALWVGR